MAPLPWPHSRLPPCSYPAPGACGCRGGCGRRPEGADGRGGLCCCTQLRHSAQHPPVAPAPALPAIEPAPAVSLPACCPPPQVEDEPAYGAEAEEALPAEAPLIATQPADERAEEEAPAATQRAGSQPADVPATQPAAAPEPVLEPVPAPEPASAKKALPLLKRKNMLVGAGWCGAGCCLVPARSPFLHLPALTQSVGPHPHPFPRPSAGLQSVAKKSAKVRREAAGRWVLAPGCLAASAVCVPAPIPHVVICL